MKLDAFQQAFAHSVMAKKSPHALAQHFKQYSNAEFEERISIYRNNFFASTSDVLKETFSTIEKLVGEDFFRALASAYIQQHPPKQPAMIFLGHDFPQFIRRFEHTQSLPYLADIAQFDWAQHTAYFAKDATPLTPNYFASQDNAHLAESRFILHPSVHLISSDFAIFSIWQTALDNQQGETVNYSEPQSVLIVRPDVEVKTYQLSQPMRTLIQALMSGKPLLGALEAATNQADTNQVEFDPGEAVNFVITSGLIINLEKTT